MLLTQKSIINALEESIEDKEAFAREFALWKEDMDQQVEPMIKEMGVIYNNYAESAKPFDEAYYDLFDELSALSNRLNAMIYGFPQLDRILNAVQLHVLKVEDSVKKELPSVSPAMHGTGDPLGHVVAFYKAAQERNILGTGVIFEID